MDGSHSSDVAKCGVGGSPRLCPNLLISTHTHTLSFPSGLLQFLDLPLRFPDLAGLWCMLEQRRRMEARPAVSGSLTLSEPGTQEGKATAGSQDSSTQSSARHGSAAITQCCLQNVSKTDLSLSIPYRILEGAFQGSPPSVSQAWDTCMLKSPKQLTGTPETPEKSKALPSSPSL